MQSGGRGIPVLERGSTVDSPSNRVGSVGATDRPMALYTSRREPVTYPRGTIWIVIGVLATLFAIFFGWILFFH